MAYVCFYMYSNLYVIKYKDKYHTSLQCKTNTVYWLCQRQDL